MDVISIWLFRFLTFAVAGLVYATFERCRQYVRLSHIPGPRTTGFSWWWHSRAVLSGECHLWYGNASERYGPLVRVAPNHLITSAPEFWAHMNSARSKYTRAPWYYHAARFEPGKDNVFTECDSERHDARRKKMAAGYSGKENPGLEESIDASIRELTELIRSKYASPAASTHVMHPMDMASKIQYLTLDVISAVGLGKPFGDLRTDSDVNDYVKASGEGLHIGNTAFGLGFSWLRGTPIIGKLVSPSEKDASGYGRMMAEVRKVVEARKAEPTNTKSDMIASFIRHGVSGDDLFQEVFEQILAGSDTTSAAIRITLLFLMSHPRVYAKLQSEIDSAVKAPDRLAAGIVSDAEIRQLPYLCAVIRESMRVHPPVVNLFSRVAPPHGDLVNIEGREYFIPGGTMIGYSAWAMHRKNTAIYGIDAEVFRPERWLLDDNNPEARERLSQMYRVNDMVFGHGKWSCLGKVVAMIEMHKTIFELLRNFDLAITNPREPWDIYDTLGLFQIRNMWVDVTERL